MRTASGPPPAARARSPAWIQATRGVRVGGAIVARAWTAGLTSLPIMPSLHTYSPVYMEHEMTATRQPRTTTPAVSQISTPEDARVLSTLSRIHYEDAFAINVGADVERTSREWVRAVLEDAPPNVRRSLWLGWTALGLRLGPPWASNRVLGWNVARR